MKKWTIAAAFAAVFVCGGLAVNSPPREVTLTELQATKLELIAQKLVGTSQQMQMLQVRLQQLQADQARLKQAYQDYFAALCKEAKLDPSKAQPSMDFKKLIVPEVK